MHNVVDEKGLYTNWVCFHVPPQWREQADELKEWAIQRKYPVRIYFCDSGVCSYNIGDTQGSDGYCSDIWGSSDSFETTSYFNGVKTTLEAYFEKFPTKEAFKSWKLSQRECRLAKVRSNSIKTPSFGLAWIGVFIVFFIFPIIGFVVSKIKQVNTEQGSDAMASTQMFGFVILMAILLVIYKNIKAGARDKNRI